MHNILSWDNYFMSIAKIASLRSKDPNTKVGAVLVDSSHHIVGTGYNGFPSGIDETQLPLNRDGDFLNTKYPFIVHAELNCILNTTVLSLQGTTLYCTLFPCNECTKAIIQKGIKDIVYLEDKYHNLDAYIASRRLLDLANIKYRQLQKFSVKDILNTISNYGVASFLST